MHSHVQNPNPEHHITQLTLLIDATQAINSTLDLDKLLKIILEKSINSLTAEREIFYLLDETKTEISPKILSSKKVKKIFFLYFFEKKKGEIFPLTKRKFIPFFIFLKF